MEFRNLTPFAAITFGALDTRDQEYHVVALRIGYGLKPLERPRYDDPALLLTHRCEALDEEPVPLVMTDDYWGEPGRSSLRQESDLAPYKPRCDVRVNATAHAPEGQPAARWPIRLRVIAPALPLDIPPPAGLNPWMAPSPAQLHDWRQRHKAAREQAARERLLLDKTLIVTGPRVFRRRLWGWRLEKPQPALSVPVRWEAAFGGHCRVPGEPSQPPRLDEACFLNPLGRGWIEQRYFQALGQADQPLPTVLPAPQFEYPNQSIERLAVTRHPDAPLDAARMAEVARHYPYTPAGLGAIGRSWTPRLQLAGTYDRRWEEHRWPFLPRDFDFGYWNGAPLDQQIPYPPPDLAVELCHLCHPDSSAQGHLGAQLPGHRACLWMRCQDGVILPLPMVIDTLLIDTEAMQIVVVWRGAVRRDLAVRVLEVHLETHPQKPLFPLPSRPAAPDSDTLTP